MAETSGPKRYERGSEEFARTLALSDGVFAIALTMLVVSIGLPTVADAQSAGALWAALAELSPDFVSWLSVPLAFVSTTAAAFAWALTVPLELALDRFKPARADEYLG